MTKLDIELQPLAPSYASQPDLGSVRRLIVPVTSPEADLTTVTQRVWELASAGGAHILFIGICQDPTLEHSLRRSLITMSAMLNFDNVSAEAEVISGRDWLENIKSHSQVGDMVVCIDGQRAGVSQKPLSQILQAELNIPLYILTGTNPKKVTRSNWQARLAVWIGFSVIIIGFFMLQVKIDHFAQNWTVILQVLTTAVEFWLIWTWNKLF